MLEKELALLKQTELDCRAMVAEAKKEAARIEAAARQEALREYEKYEKAAAEEGAALLEKARADAEAEGKALLEEKKAEIAAMQGEREVGVETTVEKLIERLCCGDDRADEPF